MAAAENAGMWQLGAEKGAEAFENAWRCADLRQSNAWRQCEASGLRTTSKISTNSDSVTITARES